MASSGLVIKKLSVASGVPLPWLDRSLRPLRTADLIALGGGGGRYQKAEAHFQVSHILNVVWGLAGHLPSDAAEAAIIVNGLRLVRTDEAGAPVSARGGPTMGDAMAATLTAAAEYLRAKARGGPPEPWPPIPSAITISLRGGQFAEVHWEGFARQRDLYIPEGGYTSRGALSQTTTVGRPILVAAAELLGDTLNHQERLRAASAHENAETLPGASASTRSKTNRSHNGRTGESTTPEAKRACQSAQVAMPLSVGRSSFPTGADHEPFPRRPPPT